MFARARYTAKIAKRLDKERAERLNLYLDRHDNADPTRGSAAEGAEDAEAPKEKNKWIKKIKKNIRIVIPHVGLVLLSAAYTILGASIFHHYEKPHELHLRNKSYHVVLGLKEKTINSLWEMRSDSSYENFTAVAHENMNEIIRRVFDDFTKNYMIPVDVITGDGPVKWSFGSSIFFSWTAITTIGYGHIVPRTDEGRIVIIFYALFGIPLILVTIADMGRFLSGGIILVHNMYRRLMSACWKKTGKCIKAIFCCCCLWRRRRLKGDDLKVNKKESKVSKDPIKTIDILKKQQKLYKKAAKRAAAQAAAANIPHENMSDAGTFDDISEIHTVAPSENGLPNGDRLSHIDEERRGDDLDTEDEDEEDETESQIAEREHNEKRVSVLFVLFIMLGYVAGGAYVMRFWENWSFFESFYFCFVTVTTIGFGDIVPINVDFFPATLAYIVLGLIITTMCIDLVGSEYIRDIHFYGRTLGRRFMTIGGKVVHLGEVFGYVAFLQKNYGLTPEQLNKLAQLPEEYLLDCLINGRQPDLNWIGGRPFVPADIYYFKWIEHPRTLSIASERALASMESLDLNTSRCSTARTLTPREYYQRILFQYCKQMQPDDAFLEIDEG
ncbi:hypothetical protein PFISCL1PPCAC_453 [Pristionchus fissidentatus]|uniref:Potassium channel domain-containing protein n=1 Tax=Pristionchus fissidentatus TaxID=1538716 RepID=A0AAV5URR7_9BILA|nr:hypothetical protein PFISCL1PPCAC_453 [Pristionchus fissidentatus]